MRFGEDNVFPVDDHEGASRLRHYFYDCSRIYALLTYVRKFMQRAAASTPPTTYRLQSRGADTPPSKRQKTFHTPTSAATPSPDQQLIETALGKEGEKRENAIETLAAEAGETKWVLSTVNFDLGEDKEELRTEVAGYSDIDQDAWRPPMVGRRSFGKFNRELEVGSVNSILVIALAQSMTRICNFGDSCFRLEPLCVQRRASNTTLWICKANRHDTHTEAPELYSRYFLNLQRKNVEYQRRRWRRWREQL